MLPANNPEDKLTPVLKSLAFFSTGSLFIVGLVVLLEYAIIESSPYIIRRMDKWVQLIFAHFIFEFCYSIIAFVLLSMEKLS